MKGGKRQTQPKRGLVPDRLCELAGILSIALFTVSLAFGQIQTEPPPLKAIPKTDLEKLERLKDAKDRTKLALELMDYRVAAAENANRVDDLRGVFTELGVFHALMDETLEFIGANQRMTGKSLNNFKRFEIGLRRFTPRLEMLRREMPLSHEYYVRSLLRQLRDARTKATEPLFGDPIIKDDSL